MESILKADIFFFITSIFVVIFSVILLISSFYFIKIIRNFYKISVILKNYTKDTEVELREMGDHIRSSRLFTFIFGKEKNKRKVD